MLSAITNLLDMLALGNRIWCSLNDIEPCNSASCLGNDSVIEHARAMRIRQAIGSSRIRHCDEFSVAARQSWWTRVRCPFVFVNRGIYSRHRAATNRPCVRSRTDYDNRIGNSAAVHCVARNAKADRQNAALRNAASFRKNGSHSLQTRVIAEMRLHDAGIASLQDDR